MANTSHSDLGDSLIHLPATTTDNHSETQNPTQAPVVSFPTSSKPSSLDHSSDGSNRHSQDTHPASQPIQTTPQLTSSTSSPSIANDPITPPSSLHFVEPTPFSTASPPASHPAPTEKKKQSFLRRLSLSSRRASPGRLVSGSAVPDQQSGTEPSVSTSLSQRSKRTLSLSAPIQRLRLLSPGSKSHHSLEPALPPPALVHQEDHPPGSSTAIAKGMRSVARTVKKSLHQLERPRSLIVERQKDGPPGLAQVAPNRLLPAVEALAPQTESDSSSPPAVVPALPTPTSRGHDGSVGESDAESGGSLAPSSATSQVADGSEPAPRVPKRPKKLVKERTASTIEARRSDRPRESRLSWRAEAEFGSLPLAASILAAPPLPSLDHASFLALIPGQPPVVVPALSLMPPSPSAVVEQPLITGASMYVEPPHSCRASPQSSLVGDGDQDGDNGFTFIRPPPDDEEPASVASPSAGADWTEVLDQSLCVENVGGDDFAGSSQLNGPLESAGEENTLNFSQVDLCPVLSPDTPPRAEVCVSPTQEDNEATEPGVENVEQRAVLTRKRKVGSPTNPGFGKHARRESDEERSGWPELPRLTKHSKVLGCCPTAAYGRPGRRLAVASCLASSKRGVEGSGVRRTRNRRIGSTGKDGHQAARRKSAAGDGAERDNSPGRQSRRRWDLLDWNHISLVSTAVVGVVAVAVVMIGSSSGFGGLNGKSFLGSWIKKMGS